MQKNIFILLLSLSALQLVAQNKFNIKTFGATGDGIYDNANAIQKAIDAAGKNGGGIVIVPAGKFLTSPFQFRSGVQLQLQENAELIGSARRPDYGNGDAQPLISANGLKNISITGKGTISGNAKALLADVFEMLNAGTLQDPEWKTENPWHQKRPTEANRPQIIHFFNCSNIHISGIRLINATTWVQDYKECNHLTIDHITVESNAYWNNDGIDVVDCKNVNITNCFVNAADDGICLKSENANSICENILIKQCKVRSSASAIKFGTASHGGFRNIRVEDIDVYDTYRSAIALEAVDGGILDSIFVKNITAKNTGNAIFIKLGHRNKTDTISKVQHIVIKNITARIPSGKPDKGYDMEGPEIRYPHNVFPASISGLPGHPVKDITLENISIEYEGGGDSSVAKYGLDSLERITENASGYPEFSMFGELPAWGLYVRHAEGITIKNIRLGYQKEDFRTACIFNDVTGLNVNGLTIKTASSSPVILLNHIKDQVIKGLDMPKHIAGAVLQQ